MKTTIAVSALVILLTGCAGTMLDMERSNLQSQGHPPQFVDGYVDGCGTGKKAAGSPYYQFVKNHNRYNQDVLYSQGWDNGFTTCKSRYEKL